MGNRPADDVMKSYTMYEEQRVKPVPSGSGKDFQQLSQPLESEGGGMPEVLPIQTVSGDNTASNIIKQMSTDKGDFSTDDDTADGTECTIACINMMKANSTRQILN